jgi:betaine-aldehyde dehydrogenase
VQAVGGLTLVLAGRRTALCQHDLVTTSPGVFLDGALHVGAGQRRALVDPATGAASGQVSEADAGQVARAVAAARSAFAGWAARTAGERARVLLRLADLVEADADRLTELEVRQTGKPVAVFRDGELPFAADNLRFFAGSARSLEGTGAGVLSAGYTSMLVRRPIGVVAGIAPWNFPLVMAIWKLGPALAAGNAVVLKPAPTTPGTPSSPPRPACPPASWAWSPAVRRSVRRSCRRPRSTWSR